MFFPLIMSTSIHGISKGGRHLSINDLSSSFSVRVPWGDLLLKSLKDTRQLGTKAPRLGNSADVCLFGQEKSASKQHFLLFSSCPLITAWWPAGQLSYLNVQLRLCPLVVE